MYRVVIEGQMVRIDGYIWTINIDKLHYDKDFGMMCAGLNEDIVKQGVAKGAKFEIVSDGTVYPPVRSEEWSRVGKCLPRPSIKFPGKPWNIAIYPLAARQRKKPVQQNLF